MARFAREAQIISQLDHPNIVTIYAVEEVDGRPLIAMEHIDGHTLGEKIPEQGLPLRSMLDYAVPLADALTRPVWVLLVAHTPFLGLRPPAGAVAVDACGGWSED